jgi:GntR family transcriptional regulator/MocR family aminotransferase
MIGASIQIDSGSGESLQEQLRVHLVRNILDNQYLPDKPLPSCRQLSLQLGISRNTVARVYDGLCDDGFLISKPRRGYYVAPNHQENINAQIDLALHNSAANAPKWGEIFKKSTSNYLTVVKPAQWMNYEHPFVYGQLDTDFFPIEHWRAAERKVTGNQRDKEWLYDRFDHDYPVLIEQIRTQVLPKRGVFAEDYEIILTLGAQNALSLVAELLLDKSTTIAVENPGYREAISTFSLQGASILPHEIDDDGIKLSKDSKKCDFFYITPNHQSPTGVSLSQERRTQLLKLASRHNQIIIEDDFDSHINTNSSSQMALKSEDKEGRVIYVGSLSKIVSPGLRLGYIVGSMELIDELRSLRRLRYRHPPTNIQYQMAQFIKQGYYETYLKRYHRCSKKRHDILKSALETYLPQCIYKKHNASAFWIKAPEYIDTQYLAWQAAKLGVLIEPGEIHFSQENPPKNYFRLGFNAIRPEAIEKGIKKLSEAMDTVIKRHCKSG